MSDTETKPTIEEASQQRTRPARTFDPNRRPTPSEKKSAIKALTRAIKKEEKRAEVVRDLDIQIENLSHKLNSLRTAHIRQP